jgi:zinc/manganese transport system substrate-binding protein
MTERPVSERDTTERPTSDPSDPARVFRPRKAAQLFALPPGVLLVGVLLLLGVLLLPAAGCGPGGTAGPGGTSGPGGPAGTGDGGPGAIPVVAAENFWGSIAAQLGGQYVQVTSIIDNPNADPHDYEPTAQDALSIERARLVIENGIGYDPWVDRLLGASSGEGRSVVDVGEVVGLKPGDNPHQWYSPDSVHKVIARITAELKALDPAHSAYFDEQRRLYETQGLSRYDSLIAEIRATYGGTPIGASESIVSPLAQALGLDLITPQSFLNAISEGTEPAAQDKATVDTQIEERQIEIYIYNSQNAIPDIQGQVEKAQTAGIPVVAVSETLEPPTATFQDWQVAQLESIQAALAAAAGE